MKQEIPIRITVLRPLAGVSMKVQRGKDELLPPIAVEENAIAFEFEITVDLSAATPNFLGKYAQGPKDQRFIYVNSGSYAGQPGTCWNRRAKISLMSVTREQIEALVAKPGTILEAKFEGIGRDGGPTCASVKGVEWKVVSK
ncbi:MAG TPA: DUF5990 family protein [Pyrinomonadaceae bacterium]|nr:DUF5990 family protein [Pyrinomonadaceae bacterium]